MVAPHALRTGRDVGRATRHVLGRGAELGTAGDQSARPARDRLRLLDTHLACGSAAYRRTSHRSCAGPVPDVLGAAWRVGEGGRVREVVQRGFVRYPCTGERAT